MTSSATNDSHEQEVVITRVLNVPRTKLFEYWTDARHLAEWWGPKGHRATATTDPRPGGRYRLVVHAPDGTDFRMSGNYLELVPPERIVMIVDMSDMPGDWIRMMSPDGDPDALNSVMSVTFEESSGKDGGPQTIITIVSTFKTVAVRDAFVTMGMNEGWAESLDKLEARLRGYAL